MNAPRRLTFPGLHRFVDGLLDDIARNNHLGCLNCDAVAQVITRTAQRLQQQWEQYRHQGELSLETQAIVRWFACFGQPDRFNQYVQAVRQAQTTFNALAKDKAWKMPLLVHFRPSSHVFRWRVLPQGTRIVLPTPMVTFDVPMFQQLGQYMLGNKQCRQQVHTAMTSPAYQQLSNRLNGQHSHSTPQRTYDLAALFDTLNRQYFDNSLERPRLAWTRQLTYRTFGQYDFINDRITISITLDRPQVPAYVIEHVMHHEMLHKKLGSQWHAGRRHCHTPEFRRLERAFASYEQANHFLKNIGRQLSVSK